MMSDKIINLQNSFNIAFINQTFQSSLAYRPQFIYNDNKNGQKVFSSIEEELLRCDSFAISEAFITRGGITPLLQTLKELERKHIPGRILTTDYLCFSDPGALDTLASLSNIDGARWKWISYEGIYISEIGGIPFYYWKLQFNPRCANQKYGMEYEACFYQSVRNDSVCSG